MEAVTRSTEALFLLFSIRACYLLAIVSDFGNRLKKNLAKLRPWAQRQGYEAYRIYDLDIPEFPVLIDVYKDRLVIADRSNPTFAKDQNSLQQIRTDLAKLLPEPPWQHHWRTRRQREGAADQYEALDQKGEFFAVQEGPYRFLVNLEDYLDTGLFLDHRPLRQKISKLKPAGRFLNLFCYTASQSVPRALVGDETVNVDLSTTYLNWAQRNFELNRLPLKPHVFLKADVLQWLEVGAKFESPFDLILLDPPTFSISKKMTETLDVQRDHGKLIRSSMKILKSDGLLIFSSNKRSFKMDADLLQDFDIQDVTKRSLPQDFHDEKIHVCFEIRYFQS